MTPDDSPAEAGASGVRAAPRALQLRWLAIAAAAVVLLGAGTWALRHWLAAGPGPGPAAPPGTFHPSAQQLKTLTIEAVASHRFESVELADGRIAVNADRATAVYSPFSGRGAALSGR